MPTWSMAMLRSSAPDCTSGIGKRLRGISGRFMSWLASTGQDHAAGLTTACGARCAKARVDRRDDAGRIEPAGRQQLRRVAVIEEPVGQPEMQHGNRDAGRGQRFGDAAAGAAHHDVFLDRDERRVVLGEPQHELDVERLHEAHVDDGRVERLRRGQRVRHDAAEREERDAVRCAGRIRAGSRPRPTGSAVIARSTATPVPLPRG